MGRHLKGDHLIVAESPYGIKELHHRQLSTTEKKVALVVSKITDMDVLSLFVLRKARKATITSFPKVARWVVSKVK